jgi:phosphoglucosamine mutase
MGKLFGTDGIRGEANVAPMTPETALSLGRALAAELLAQETATEGTRPRVVIGKDTRLSGYIFEEALAAGFCAMGGDVLLCGPLPTPGIAFITASMRADVGVVISGSHNPYYDNGIKIFSRDGFKLPDHVENHLEQVIRSGVHKNKGATRDAIGKAYRVEGAWARYVVFLKAVLPSDLKLDGMKIVVDCANGAAYKVAPAVFEELGATVVATGCSPDGTNINSGCGSLHPERMCELVREHQADLGIALDGDADRVIVADENGALVDGDRLIALSAMWMHREGNLKHNTVVGTVMSNMGLEIALKNQGIQFVRTAVGDRYVADAMRKGGFNLGGEQSGHLIYLDHTSTGDGVVAALKTMTVMLREGKPLSELAQVMQQMPQVLVNVQVSSKPPMEQLPAVTKAIDRVEAQLGEEGRVLVRYSGTEPKARVMIEGSDQAQINAFADEIADELREAVGA